MRKFLLICLTVFLCATLTSCSKYEGTYVANCDNIQHGAFKVTLELKSNGKFSLYTKHETMELLDKIKYSGTYEIEKSNDGSEYDTLILHYNEYSEIDGVESEEQTKTCKITTKGTKVIITNFFAESKITLKKQ